MTKTLNLGRFWGVSLMTHKRPMPVSTCVENRLRKKRSKVLHTKAGSGTSMKVRFNRFNFSNSYIWFEFYKAPLPSDISLICDLSQAPVDRRPSYDAIQGANVTPTTFYNIGDFEIQENLGRVWVDIGTGETLLLDILINALTQISSDFKPLSLHRVMLYASSAIILSSASGWKTTAVIYYVGIKEVVFGGSEFESWNENLTSEENGCSVHKI
ncbi:hypothetical protein Syun_026225 [Stephania yunnanensis]|uniref:Uncharacterized protein n=1 Tax=Stephania yunnanensis TaxID=152371 RepID=A0AAP0HWU1_9MAGN